ncbi:hypothetical protein V1514DRAFT_307238 [Lipomyces japonicus]|uniref:uncharacterized protein n=1 Tax=Lipomyces japonicus TaxID=56871 RepID=UPI0034CECDA5
MSSVAVFGTHGFLFRPVVDALTSGLFKGKYQLPVKAFSRDPSKEEPIEGVEFVKVDYANLDSIVADLKGVHAVINLIGFNPGAWDTVSQATAKAGAEVYFPSDFGIDFEHVKVNNISTLLDAKTVHADAAKKLGIPKVVRVYTGLFLAFLVGGFFGHNFKEGKVAYLGDGTQTITSTDLADIGRSVASLAYRPASEIPEVVAIQGNAVTLLEISNTYENVTGKKLEASFEEPATVASLASSQDALFVLKNLAAHPETYTFNFKTNQNELVNPGLWQWKTVEEAIKESKN